MVHKTRFDVVVRAEASTQQFSWRMCDWKTPSNGGVSPKDPLNTLPCLLSMRRGSSKLFFVLLLLALGFACALPAYQSGASVNVSSNATTTEIPSLLYNASADAVYAVNLTGFTQTKLWAAVYGNVAGNVTLASNDSSTTYKLISWTADGVGNVYAVNSSSVPLWANIVSTPWTGSQLDAYLGFDAAWSDNANHTFTYNNSLLTVGTKTIPAGTGSNTAAKSENYSNSTVWETIALNDTTGTPVFTCLLQTSQTAYNGEAADFQLLLPNNQKVNGPPTVYYFYLELH